MFRYYFLLGKHRLKEEQGSADPEIGENPSAVCVLCGMGWGGSCENEGRLRHLWGGEEKRGHSQLAEEIEARE